MKVLKSADGTPIAYAASIALSTDGAAYLCDGVLYPMLVVGAGCTIEDGATPPQDAAAIAADIEDRLDADLDALAQSWGYKNSNRLAGYVSSTVAKWQAEAQAFIAGRDAWWTKAASIQAAWTPGSPIPTYDSVRAEMPPIVRPT